MESLFLLQSICDVDLIFAYLVSSPINIRVLGNLQHKKIKVDAEVFLAVFSCYLIACSGNFNKWTETSLDAFMKSAQFTLLKVAGISYSVIFVDNDMNDHLCTKLEDTQT